MTDNATPAALAAVIDALALMQGQLDRVERSNGRIEEAQREILGRLDTIDAGQAAVTDLVPVLETILARLIEDRELAGARISRVAQLAALAHAAALGNGAPLPADAIDDPLLEQYLLTQPADRTATKRALVEWQGRATSIDSAELVHLLGRQYRPSPTDTAQTRLLRYQLAAITRAELQGRGVALPPAPTSTRAEDRSSGAAQSRSAELAALWRAGESTALLAEPELAAAIDLFEAAERQGRGRSEQELAAGLAELHRALGDRVAAGERPSTDRECIGDGTGRLIDFGPDPVR